MPMSAAIPVGNSVQAGREDCKLLFFSADRQTLQIDAPVDLKLDYSHQLWMPTILPGVPRGIADFKCALGFLYLWASKLLIPGQRRCYFILIYHGQTLVHYTGVLRACF